MIGSLNSNNNGSIGNLGKKEVSRYDELSRKIDEINREINDLESALARMEFSDSIDKDYGNLQRIQSNSITNRDTITTDIIQARIAELTDLRSTIIKTGSIEADNLYGQIKDTQNEATINTLHSNSIDANEITATNATFENVKLTNIDVDDVKADTAEIDSATIDNEQVNTSNITSANITTLESNAINSGSIESNSLASKTANIDELTSKEVVSDEVKAEVIENSNLIGYNVISLGNLTPLDNDDDQQFYCLKLKKPFEKMTLKWPGSFECVIQSAMAEPETQVTHSASVIWLHQKQLNEVLRVSEDNEYVYIDVAPFNSNEDTRLYYKVEAKESLEDRITYSINEHPVYDFYYNPTRLSEVIIAGDGTEKYQLTVLGKLWAKLSPDFENTVFEDITVNNNLYLKDFYNTVSGDWEYKKGEVNDYLSNIENGIDEETGEQKTRIDWRKRVAFRNPNQYIVTTEDSKEDVLVDGTKIGERVVKANVNTLIDLGTLRNYNGQWVTEEPEPADTHDFSFNSDSNPETLVAGFGFLGTPEITESEEYVYPEEQYSWKKWGFTPTDSYTIYTTNTEDYLFEEIRTLFVEHYIGDSSEIIIAGTNSNYDPFSLSENIDYSIVATSSMKQVAKISAIGKSEEEFRNSLLATGLFDENLHPTQTIFLDDGGRQMAFDTSVYLSLSEDGPVYFDVNTSNDRFSFNGTTFLSILETTPAETHNFTYIESQDPETVAEGLSFLGTPVIEENSGYPEADLSQKIWTFTPADSWTIFSTDNDYMFYAEIKDLMVESTKDGSLITTVSIETDSVYTGLIQGVGYTIVPTSSIKSVATINVEGMSKDDFKSTLLATGLFNEVEGELHPTQAVFLRDEEEYTYAFGTEAELYFREGESYFSVFVNENEFTYTGTTISTLETTPEPTPTTKVNPITKLGTVDEGTWVAGDVTTPNLKVNESTELNKTTTINDDLHITEKVLDFGGTNYDVWDYANDNMNWVEE